MLEELAQLGDKVMEVAHPIGSTISSSTGASQLVCHHIEAAGNPHVQTELQSLHVLQLTAQMSALPTTFQQRPIAIKNVAIFLLTTTSLH